MRLLWVDGGAEAISSHSMDVGRPRATTTTEGVDLVAMAGAAAVAWETKTTGVVVLRDPARPRPLECDQFRTRS